VEWGAAEAELSVQRMPKLAKPGLWSLAAAGWVAAALGVGWFAWQARHDSVAKLVVPIGAQKAVPHVALPAPVVVEAKASAQGAASVAVQPASAVSPVLSSTSASTAGAAPAAAEPVPNGSLRLFISPWGEVLVDGRSMGLTPPLSHLTVPAGEHLVTVRNGDSPEFRQTIHLQAGKVVQIRHEF